jgi:hypothetical protein
MLALHSSMSPLDYVIEPSFNCPDDDAGDIAFVRATSSIGGRDAIEEYLACGMLPLLVNFGFGEIADGETPISKVVVPLPDLPFARVAGESNKCFLARVELEVENIVGGYSRVEHDACMKSLRNGGRLN